MGSKVLLPIYEVLEGIAGSYLEGLIAPYQPDGLLPLLVYFWFSETLNVESVAEYFAQTCSLSEYGRQALSIFNIKLF